MKKFIVVCALLLLVAAPVYAQIYNTTPKPATTQTDAEIREKLNALIQQLLAILVQLRANQGTTAPATLPTVTLTANPNPRVVNSVTGGGSVSVLSWTSTNSDYCRLNGGRFYNEIQNSSGSVQVTPWVPTTYNITCYNKNNGNAGISNTSSVTLKTTTDVDNDGDVDQDDVNYVTNCANGICASGINANVNGVGGVDAADISIINHVVTRSKLELVKVSSPNGIDQVYNSAHPEFPSLKFAFEIEVMAVNGDVFIPQYAVATWAHNETLGQVNQSSPESHIVSFSNVFIAQNSPYGTAYKLPKGMTGIITIEKSFDTGRMFAGKYYGYVDSLKYYQSWPNTQSPAFNTHSEGLVIKQQTSNSEQVLGEKSPYITSITTPRNVGDTVTITGERLTGAVALKTPSTISNIAVSSDNRQVSFKIDSVQKPGIYEVTVVDKAYGESNRAWLEIKSGPVAATGPKVTYPNGGENLIIGNQSNINWTFGGAPATNVSVYLVGGNAIQCIKAPCPSDQARHLVSANANGTSLYWTIGKIANSSLVPAGQYRVEVCSSVACDQSDNYFTISDPLINPVLPTVDLVITNDPDDRVTVTAGSLVPITWSSTNAVSCTPNNGGIVDPSSSYQFSGTINTSGSREIKFVSNGNVSITCMGPGGSVTDTVAVDIATQSEVPTPTVDLKVNGSNGPVAVPYNTYVPITWTSTNSISCTANPSVGVVAADSDYKFQAGPVNTTGNRLIKFTGTGVISITCQNAAGQVSNPDPVAVNVVAATTPPPPPPPAPAAPTVYLKINNSTGPVAVVSGATANISWGSTNAVSCTPNNGGIVDPSSSYQFSGTINTSGSREIKFNRTGVISITCQNSAGQTAQAAVTVNVTAAPVITSSNVKYPDPDTTMFVPGDGRRATINWTTTNAQSCKLNGVQAGSPAAGYLPAVGSTQVSPSIPKTFQLVCYSGANWTGTASAPLNIPIKVSTDVDGNGRVDATDLQLMTNCITDANCSLGKAKADVNRDNSLNATDQQMINNAILIQQQQAQANSTTQTASVFSGLRGWLQGLFGGN